MATSSPADITAILVALGRGEAEAAERLLPLVYEAMHALAEQQFRHERKDHTLQPTALVHEAWLRLAGAAPVAWQDRVHFLAVAATAMRRLLIDHARRRAAQRRDAGPGAVRVTLAEVVAEGRPNLDLLALEDALAQLTLLDQRQARIVELRFFSGLTIAETAGVLGLGTTTVEGEWAMARAWLSARLSDELGR